jgi:hypothetical protein
MSTSFIKTCNKIHALRTFVNDIFSNEKIKQAILIKRSSHNYITMLLRIFVTSETLIKNISNIKFHEHLEHL